MPGLASLTFAAVLVAAVAVAQAPGPAADVAASAHRERGRTYLEQGNVGAALAELRVAAEKDPRDAVARDLIGVALGESGMLDAAVASFEDALRLDPRLAQAHFHLGVAQERGGKVAEAIRGFQEAVRLEPRLTEAAYGLALACARVGDVEGAILMLRRVVAALPSLAEARYNLALNLWKRYRDAAGPRQSSDLDQAEQELRTAIQLQPAHAAAHLALGQLLAERQRHDAAVEALRKAHELSRGAPAYAYDLGLALRLQGDLDGRGDAATGRACRRSQARPGAPRACSPRRSREGAGSPSRSAGPWERLRENGCPKSVRTRRSTIPRGPGGRSSGPRGGPLTPPASP